MNGMITGEIPPKQLNGAMNPHTFNHTRIDLINQPDLLLTPDLAAMSAAYFWYSHGLNALADDETDDNDLEDFTTITKKINGDTAGLKERFALFKTILPFLS